MEKSTKITKRPRTSIKSSSKKKQAKSKRAKPAAGPICKKLNSMCKKSQIKHEKGLEVAAALDKDETCARTRFHGQEREFVKSLNKIIGGRTKLADRLSKDAEAVENHLNSCPQCKKGIYDMEELGKIGTEDLQIKSEVEKTVSPYVEDGIVLESHHFPHSVSPLSYIK